ncbi:hypothetical protein HG536_0D02230 [Torulaspora globosa]|uniref:DNA damage-inducible protein 1 n=1 Tax=Torulaspora globosa TaxID=48254 RepID=A0A7G3ZGR5_9SACH|nr:uncharacterized protein HG536_0D02230 [Torulaspora globosa]QLL32701.1 hypothetical protein HG536_0D02230 [Torulaspora globosa]
MNLTISNEITDQIYGPLELSGEMTLQDLTALLQVDCGFDDEKHEIYYNSAKLDPGSTRSLGEVFTGENHLVVIRPKSGIEASSLSDDAFVEQFRQELLHNQLLRSQLITQIPGLDQTLQNPQLFRERMGPVILQRRYGLGGADNQAQNPFGISSREYRRLMSDPDDPQNQARIAELINQQEIDEQMRNALEYTPEMFTSVHMLFVSLEINGHPVKAFVDSGAQTTIMSTRLAESTGLTRLIDRRFVGEARGVGVGKILGRIHQAQIKIETQYIPCSFTVLDTQVDLLLGLDMLKRHQACIDLHKDVLRIAGVETRFLSESEIPKDFVENMVGPNPGTAGNPVAETVPGTSPQVAGTNAAATRGADASARAFPETAIKHLMDLGFSRKEVIAALQRAGGNTEIAASILFQ